jgi:ankyrin repeat protein
LLNLLNEQDILQQVISQWAQIYGIIDSHNLACPPRSTTIIHIAAAANLVDIIERMPLNSEDMARKDGDGNTAFHLAARHGHITGGKLLREKAADCEVTNRERRTPLIEAASFGHRGFVEWLLLEGVKLEATIGRGESALQAASLGGHQKVVEILLAAGAEVNTKCGRYGNALQAAAADGRSSEIVQILLDAGADINAQGGIYGNALQAAVADGRSSEIVQMLLDAGADVNAQGGRYGNALQAACSQGHEQIVQLLLEHKADVNAQAGNYEAPIQAACSAGHDRIVQILLERAAGVNSQGREYGSIGSIPQASIFDRETQSQATYPSNKHTFESSMNVKTAPSSMGQVCAGLSEELTGEVSDDESIYSARTDVTSADKYISEVSDVLLESLEKDLPDVSALNRILGVLEELLRLFAMQLEFEINSQVARDAMVFIRHYRQ